MGNTIDRLIKVPELCRILGMGRSTLFKHMKDGVIPKPIRLGPRLIAWRASAVQAWLDALSAGPGEGQRV